MMLLTILAFTLLEQVPVPCGSTPEKPCYTAPAPVPVKFDAGAFQLRAGEVLSLSPGTHGYMNVMCEEKLCAGAWAHTSAEQELAICRLALTEQKDWFHGSMFAGSAIIAACLFLLALSRIDKIAGAWRRAEIALHMPWRLIAVLLVPSGFVMGTLAGFLGSKFFFLFLPNVKDQDVGTVPLMAFGAIVGVFITAINVDTVWKLSRK